MKLTIFGSRAITSWFAQILMLLIYFGSPASGAAVCQDVMGSSSRPDESEVPLITLWKQGQRVVDYNQVLTDLRSTQAGTILDFGEGDTVIFNRYINAGETHVIIQDAEGAAVRIPWINPNANPGTDIAGFIESQRQVRAAGINVVSVDLERSRPPKFLVVEYKDIVMTLAALKGSDWEKRTTPKQRNPILKKLLEFARSTWRFQHLGDFNEAQLGFDGKEWVLLDVATRNFAVRSLLQERHVFSPIDYGEGYIHRIVPQKIQNSIDSAIASERKRQMALGNDWTHDRIWFKRNYRTFDYMNFLFVTEEQGGADLIGREVFIHRSFLKRQDRRRLTFKEPFNEGSNVISMWAGRLISVGSDTALYSVVVGSRRSGTVGLIEVRLNLDRMRELFKPKFPLLVEKGFAKGDLDIIGPDYVLILD